MNTSLDVFPIQRCGIRPLPPCSPTNRNTKGTQTVFTKYGPTTKNKLTKYGKCFHSRKIITKNQKMYIESKKSLYFKIL